MIVRTASALALLCALMPSISSVAIAAPVTSTRQQAGVCTSLRNDYASTEKIMAFRWAEGLIDDSAPRATMRAAQDTADTAKAQLIVTLMRANHCALPNHAAAATTYMMPAMACRTDRLKEGGATEPESCKRENWQPTTTAAAASETAK